MPDNDDHRTAHADDRTGDGRTHYYGDGCPDDHGVDHLVPRYTLDGTWPDNAAADFVNACHNVAQQRPDQPVNLADVEELHHICGRILDYICGRLLDEHRRRHPGDAAGDGAG